MTLARRFSRRLRAYREDYQSGAFGDVTTNAMSTKARSSVVLDERCASAAIGKIEQVARKVRALWSVWTVGVRIPLGALS